MNVNRVDLNLLVYLDALLRERNVTQAANQLNLSQPAMSNGLRRLRELFDDPLLVRTSDGMTPTERALELEPVVREVLTTIDRAVQPRAEFEPDQAQRDTQQQHRQHHQPQSQRERFSWLVFVFHNRVFFLDSCGRSGLLI